MVLDLFAGPGGWDLGLAALVLSVPLDLAAAKEYAA